MRRSIIFLACIILAVCNVSGQSAVFARSADSLAELMAGASLSERDGIFFLHLKGSPYRMGFQHGMLLRKQIRRLYRDYLVSWLKEQHGRDSGSRLALSRFRKSAKRMAQFIPEEYKQELKGIAAGSGLSYQQVLVMHTFFDVVSYPGIVKDPVLSCTNFITGGAASAGEALIHGRNLSWPSRGLLDRNTTVVFYEPERGNKFSAISWPGICGVLTGMNERGVSLGLTSVASAESTLDGVPAFILLRDALQYSETMYDVIRNVASSRRTTGYTLAVADGKLKRSCVIECTGWHYRVRFPQKDYVASANHYQDPALFETMKSVYPENFPAGSSTFRRIARVDELVRENYGRVDLKTAESFLADPVLNTPDTFLAAVFEPEKLTFSLAAGHDNIARGVFFPIDLKTELNVGLPKSADVKDPESFFSYAKTEMMEKRRLTGQTRGYRRYQVEIPTGGSSEFFDNSIYLNYYEPKGQKDFPVILILPHFTGSKATIEGKFAEKFASEGMGAVVMDMAFQKKGRAWLAKQMKSGELSTLENLFREIILDARRTIDWLETQPGIDHQKIGVMGISLGAIAAPVVCGNDSRVKAAAYVLGGGDISKIIYSAGEAAFFRKRLTAQKITPLDFRTRFSIVDPLTYAFRAKDVPSVMYNAMFDRLIPRQSTIQLWEALEYPKMVMYPGGHYTAALFLADVRSKICRHFRSCFLGRKQLASSAGKEENAAAQAAAAPG